MTAAAGGRRSKPAAVLRGALGLCPRCGRGRLFHRYLKVTDRCAVCGEPYGHFRADDAPPWMTIIVTGHILVPVILAVEQGFHPALWVQIAVWPALALILALTLLPRCKGVVLGLLWALKAEGSERI